MTRSRDNLFQRRNERVLVIVQLVEFAVRFPTQFTIQGRVHGFGRLLDNTTFNAVLDVFLGKDNAVPKQNADLRLLARTEVVLDNLNL